MKELSITEDCNLILCKNNIWLSYRKPDIEFRDSKFEINYVKNTLKIPKTHLLLPELNIFGLRYISFLFLSLVLWIGRCSVEFFLTQLHHIVECEAADFITIEKFQGCDSCVMIQILFTFTEIVGNALIV